MARGASDGEEKKLYERADAKPLLSFRHYDPNLRQRTVVDVFCNACLRADASMIGASLEYCVACSALSAADVQRAEAAAGGAASIATPPRSTSTV
jgi:hypothetical protein